MSYPLPRETRKNVWHTECENFGLLFYRFQQLQAEDDKRDLQNLVERSPFFQPGDFRDLKVLAQILTDNTPLSRYLCSGVSPRTRKLLEKTASSSELPKELEKFLISDFDGFLKNFPIKKIDKFKQVFLRDKTRELLNQTSENQSSIYLNRLLLEDAFPYDIAKIQDSKQIYELEESKKFVMALHKRMDKLLTASETAGGESLNFPLTVDWRFVIGLGNPSVFDTGLRLHSIYGFPYLPGQGLKGAIRRVWMFEAAAKLGVPILEVAKIKELKDNNKKTPWKRFENLLMTAINPNSEKPDSDNEKRLMKKGFSDLQKTTDKDARINELGCEEFWNDYACFYQIVFGSKNTQGKVDFWDVYPKKLTVDDKSILEVDIINAHYGKYYTSKGETPPADYFSPNPIFFFCIRKNTPYQFRVILKEEAKKKKAEVEKLIKDTAEDYGLGAKTMSGYGEMN